MDKNEKKLCNELGKINTLLNKNPNCISLSDYINMTFSYYKYFYSEIERMLLEFKNVFDIDSFEIVDIEKREEDDSWNIAISLVFNDEYFSKNVYVTFKDGKVTSFDSIKLKRKESLDKFIFSDYFLNIIEFAIKHYNFLSLNSRLLFENNDDFVWLITNIKGLVPSVIFGNCNFSININFNNDKHIFVNNQVMNFDKYKVDNYLGDILIDLDKLPLFISDYINLYTKKLEGIDNQESEDINKAILYKKSLM